jgi:hypothetical protein
MNREIFEVMPYDPDFARFLRELDEMKRKKSADEKKPYRLHS